MMEPELTIGLWGFTAKEKKVHQLPFKTEHLDDNRIFEEAKMCLTHIKPEQQELTLELNPF